ncbi:hypothetical protein BK011_02725 [Tenericutes bacterium MZ-XQ]|nr:hypothetical protein BK011_02725 [Tenericutes bacterium MZ-XQ]
MKQLKITETQQKDITNIQTLWADGEVMTYVGFPDGLKQTKDQMLNWYEWIDKHRPLVNHYSIYKDNVFCGETFYHINPNDHKASLDIKLHKHARGKGIAFIALSYAIDKAFMQGADIVWVDPHKDNHKALLLYEKLGFKVKEHITSKEHQDALYMEKTKEDE